MPFQPGNTYGKGQGGRKPGAGRPSKEAIKVRKLAEEIARDYIERNVHRVMRAYIQLAAGRKVKHFNQLTGRMVYEDMEVDAPSTRHFVDKFLPSKASTKIILADDEADEFYRRMAEEESAANPPKDE